MAMKRMMGIIDTEDGRGFGLGNVIRWDRGAEEGTTGSEMGVGWAEVLGARFFQWGWMLGVGGVNGSKKTWMATDGSGGWGGWPHETMA